MSTGFNVSNGVRQGGILSPYLFCINVDELSKMLNNVHVGCFVGTMLVNHVMYADDLVMLSPSVAGLSILLSICSRYGIEYDVMYNSTKSNVLVFRSKLLKNVHVPEFEINNTAIDRVSMYKYLGHCINDELSDDDDMTRQRNKIYAQGNALIRKCTENVKFLCLNHTVLLYILVPCGANTDVNHYENCVLPITIFFVNSLTKLGIVVQARCLSRDNYRLVKC